MRLKDWKLWLNTFVHIVCIVYATKENPQNMFQLLKKRQEAFCVTGVKRTEGNYNNRYLNYLKLWYF